jgi:hypothetical protein
MNKAIAYADTAIVEADDGDQSILRQSENLQLRCMEGNSYTASKRLDMVLQLNASMMALERAERVAARTLYKVKEQFHELGI